MGRQAEIIDHFKLRRAQCMADQNAYGAWLAILTPLRWLTIAGSVILSTLAGANFLAKKDIGDIPWDVLSGWMAIGSAILTGLHTALHCDTYQAECARLVQGYSALTDAFEAALTVAPDKLAAKRDELEVRLAQLKESTTTLPPRYFRNKAARATR